MAQAVYTGKGRRERATGPGADDPSGLGQKLQDYRRSNRNSNSPRPRAAASVPAAYGHSTPRVPATCSMKCCVASTRTNEQTINPCESILTSGFSKVL